MPECAVAADHPDVRAPRAAQVPCRLCGEVAVDLDGHDSPGRAGELGEQRGVEAGGGADLQHALAGLHR